MCARVSGQFWKGAWGGWFLVKFEGRLLLQGQSWDMLNIGFLPCPALTSIKAEFWKSRRL